MNGIFIMPCETQHAYSFHNQRQLHHVSLNIIIIVSNIQVKHHKSTKTYGPTSQCSSKILDYIKYSKCHSTSGHNSCPQPKSLPINCSINDLDLSCYPLLILISARLKLDMFRSHRFGVVMKSGISQRSSLRVVHTCCASTLCCWNLSWFSAFDFMKNMQYACDRKITEVYVCQKLSTWFYRVLQK